MTTIVKRIALLATLAVVVVTARAQFGSYSHDLPFMGADASSQQTAPVLFWSVTNLPNYTVSYDATTNEVDAGNVWNDYYQGVDFTATDGWGPHVYATNVHFFHANYITCTTATSYWNGAEWSAGVVAFLHYATNKSTQLLTFKNASYTNGVWVTPGGRLRVTADALSTNVTSPVGYEQLGIVLTYSSANGLKLYTNGGLAWSGSGITNLDLGRDNIVVGSRAGDQSLTNRNLWQGFWGYVKCVSLWNKELSLDEVDSWNDSVNQDSSVPAINVAGTMLDYNSDSILANDGDLVSVWDDSSTNSYHLLASGAARPYYTNDSVFLGGSGFVVFDGTSDVMQTNFTAIFSQPLSAYAVMKTTTSSTGTGKVHFNAGSNGSNVAFRAINSVFQVDASTSRDITQLSPQWQIVNVVFNNPGSTFVYTNNVLLASASTAGSNSLRGFKLGAGLYATNNFADISVARFVYANKAHTNQFELWTNNWLLNRKYMIID